jgi:hypothetical protein
MRWPKERRRVPDGLLVMLVISGSRFPVHKPAQSVQPLNRVTESRPEVFI